MSDHLPYMSFYGDDFLGSTAALTGLESWAYVVWCWQAFKRNGHLPNDDRKLRMWARCDQRHFARIKRTVLEEHWTLAKDKTHWTNDRVDKEVLKATKIRERAKANGSKGGRPRKEAEAQGAARQDAPDKRDSSGRASTAKKANEINGDENQEVSQGKPTKKLPISQVSERDSNESLISSRSWPADACQQFIDAYPHKVGLDGPRGLKASWMQIEAKHVPGLPWKTVMDGLKRYLASKRPDEPWLKPLTFMLDERWTDQPAAPALPQPKQAPTRKPRESGVMAALNMINGASDDDAASDGSELPSLAADATGPALDETAGGSVLQQDGEGPRAARHVHKK